MSVHKCAWSALFGDQTLARWSSLPGLANKPAWATSTVHRNDANSSHDRISKSLAKEQVMSVFSRSTLLRSVTALLVAIAALVAYSAAGNNALAASPGAGHFIAHSHTRPDHEGKKRLSATQLAFHDGMRKLWEDHVTWTRLFIVSFAADLPDTDATAQRLLQNQIDLGDAIKPFYGEAAGSQLTALLREHILIAADLLQAAKAGDSAGVADANARWYANADEIATFLHQANPDEWPLDEMKLMMRTHLDLTLAEAVARLQGDWPADIAAYEQVHEEILHMADMLSAGIIRQFPKQFRR
jgi:hypothetical protein